MVTLEDGSRVSLDAATRVTVEYTRSARKLHLLAGRAKFDVAKNADRPFTVTAGDRTVVATGTAFSVELFAHEVRVILYEGHVRVLAGATLGNSAVPVELASVARSRRAISADQALKPGTVLITPLDKPVATVQPTEAQPSLSWQGGQLVFTDDPLAVAVERIDRYADNPIIVEGAAAQLPISGAFNAGDSAGFIDGVSALYPLKTTRRGDALVLTLENHSS
jgi:transmembrane sensor